MKAKLSVHKAKLSVYRMTVQAIPYPPLEGEGEHNAVDL